MKKNVLIGCGTIFIIALIGVVAIGIWLFIGPESGVKYGNEMDSYALDYLEKNHILKPDENLVAYYDTTISMDGTEAAILTSKRVIYHKSSGNYEIDLTDIHDIRHQKKALMGDVIEIQAISGKLMKIEVALLNGGESFLSALMGVWEKAKSGKDQGKVEMPPEGANQKD